MSHAHLKYGRSEFVGTEHSCACAAQAALAELVAAAIGVWQDTDEAWTRLHAALKPFREEKPICGCDPNMHVCGTS